MLKEQLVLGMMLWLRKRIQGGALSIYLTAEVPGTGGTIKGSPEDFLVEEIPAYLPSGQGEHCFAVLEKRGIATLEALRRIAKTLGVQERDLGYAGMKDAIGVTRQTVSIPRVAPDKVLALEIPGIKILSARMHGNKLRLGHLKGNRFVIRVRDVAQGAVKNAEAALEVMTRRGVPNRFGVQRYGAQGNTHEIGAAMLRREFKSAVDRLIGDPAAVTDERWRQAIEAYRRGEVEESLALFPGHFRVERELLTRLVQRPDGFERAFNSVQPRMKRLYLSAFQSSLFDLVLEKRLDSFDKVNVGDIAFKHENGARFLVQDLAAEAPRAEAFDISPTGPMFGCTMMEPHGAQGELEREVLAAQELTLESFNLSGGLRMEGERRPLRVPIAGADVQQEGSDLLVGFSLPRGAYATCVMSEIMKSE
ncbi:tRNA pseudouridine 13 synthase [Citrifermentans bemidjiense Bem]|uniref:tRNA pseudouridine synthase D n=2 Tax=Citrifermentans bemidjiense TaxID=225194 RepID=B5EHY1_CITBB|nr:tRNA pseudouridine 13 synthase [Citrifermentans bemidjiense Bem]